MLTPFRQMLPLTTELNNYYKNILLPRKEWPFIVSASVCSSLLRGQLLDSFLQNDEKNGQCMATERGLQFLFLLSKHFCGWEFVTTITSNNPIVLTMKSLWDQNRMNFWAKLASTIGYRNLFTKIMFAVYEKNLMKIVKAMKINVHKLAGPGGKNLGNFKMVGKDIVLMVMKHLDEQTILNALKVSRWWHYKLTSLNLTKETGVFDTITINLDRLVKFTGTNSKASTHMYRHARVLVVNFDDVSYYKIGYFYLFDQPNIVIMKSNYMVLQNYENLQVVEYDGTDSVAWEDCKSLIQEPWFEMGNNCELNLLVVKSADLPILPVNRVKNVVFKFCSLAMNIFSSLWSNSYCETAIFEETEIYYSALLTPNPWKNKKVVLSMPVNILDQRNGIHDYFYLFLPCEKICLIIAVNNKIDMGLAHLTSLISRTTFPHLKDLHVKFNFFKIHIPSDQTGREVVLNKIFEWIQTYWWSISHSDQFKSFLITIISHNLKFEVDLLSMNTFNGMTSKKIDFLNKVTLNEMYPETGKNVESWCDLSTFLL